MLQIITDLVVISRCGNVATLRVQRERLRVVDFGKDAAMKDRILPTNSRVVSDMTELHFTHEPAILSNLQARALNKQPYTFIGNVLVSINPVRRVPEPSQLDDSPHPRTVAERAFQRMSFAMSQTQVQEDQGERGGEFDSSVKHPFGGSSELNMNQTILISGESGSGKTEGAKRVLIHLVDRESYKDYALSERPELYNLQDKILGSDPLLEAFGNAKTQKNHNSSRFGKFLRLYYETEEDYPENLILCGASITTYLLERSRVTTQIKAERNFRIFYQLLTANSKALTSQLGFPQTDYTFRYLGSQKIRKQDLDKTGYLELRTALRMARLSVKNVDLFEVIAAVLHIGNISFVSESTAEGEVSRIEAIPEGEYNPIKFVTELLKIDENLLQGLLCEKRVELGKDIVYKRFDVQTSIRTRDAIAKHVYFLLFDW